MGDKITAILLASQTQLLQPAVKSDITPHPCLFLEWPCLVTKVCWLTLTHRALLINQEDKWSLPPAQEGKGHMSHDIIWEWWRSLITPTAPDLSTRLIKSSISLFLWLQGASLRPWQLLIALQQKTLEHPCWCWSNLTSCLSDRELDITPQPVHSSSGRILLFYKLLFRTWWLLNSNLGTLNDVQSHYLQLTVAVCW